LGVRILRGLRSTALRDGDRCAERQQESSSVHEPAEEASTVPTEIRAGRARKARKIFAGPRSVGPSRRGGQGLGMRSVLLIIALPCRPNSRLSGCSVAPPKEKAPRGARAGPHTPTPTTAS